MDKVQGRSWWSLVRRRSPPKPQASDFGNMGDTIALDSWLDRDSRLSPSAAEAATPARTDLAFPLNREPLR